MKRRVFLAVQILVAQRPRVEPLHEVFEDGRARFGKVDGRGDGFEEAVRGVEGGGEKGGGGTEDFAVDGEDDFAGAGRDVDDGFEELADGDVGFGRGRGRQCWVPGRCWDCGDDFRVCFNSTHRDLCISSQDDVQAQQMSLGIDCRSEAWNGVVSRDSVQQ